MTKGENNMTIMTKELRKKVIKSTIEELMECELLRGKYDAKNGNEHYMYGIATVMERLALEVSEEYSEKISNIFIKNMIESEKKALTE